MRREPSAGAGSTALTMERRARQKRSCESSCERRGERLEVLEPAWRRSGLRERSAGATICSSSPAARGRAVPEPAAGSAARCRSEPAGRRQPRRRRRAPGSSARLPRGKARGARSPRAHARTPRSRPRARRVVRGRWPARHARASCRQVAASCAGSPGGDASSSRMIRSGRNSSRCRRRIVRRRSTSSSV